ncbi:hypothetical protein EII17_06605 [Clostridiales bacterium COT073_COT-073]|nr:hypothetical protein EII17_06605 [Clostridiales bacterium COT073_COT-073]
MVKMWRLVRNGIGICLMASLIIGMRIKVNGADLFNSFFTPSSPVPEIIFFAETPDELLTEAKALFAGYQVQKAEKRHLARFFEGTEIVLAYDVQALPLIESDDDTFFYPLYEDRVILALNQKELKTAINDWPDIWKETAKVNLIDQEPEQRYLWINIAYGLSGRLEKERVLRYLSSLYQWKRLSWDDDQAPIQVTFYSHYLQKHQPEKKIVYPASGSFAFQVGFLSQRPIAAHKIEKLRKVYRDLGFLPIDQSTQSEGKEIKQIFPVRTMFKEFMNFGEIERGLIRDIQQKRKHTPLNGVEHQAVTLVLIIIITLGISYVYKTVIHLGVRKGIGFTGLVLICFMMQTVFKYSYEGDPAVIRGLWYSFYLFILLLPPTTLYIMNNVNCWDKKVFPNWLKIAWGISFVLLLMVVTNDYHQWVFRFTTTDSTLWSDHYEHTWGYYVIALWMIITQIGSWVYLMRKSWDSPKKKIAVLPILVVVLGIVYALMYNLKVAFFREISLALAMSGLGILFWGSILLSGLIPSNSGYWELFENSRLAMKIFDKKGNLRFESSDKK